MGSSGSAATRGEGSDESNTQKATVDTRHLVHSRGHILARLRLQPTSMWLRLASAVSLARTPCGRDSRKAAWKLDSNVRNRGLQESS